MCTYIPIWVILNPTCAAQLTPDILLGTSSPTIETVTPSRFGHAVFSQTQILPSPFHLLPPERPPPLPPLPLLRPRTRPKASRICTPPCKPPRARHPGPSGVAHRKRRVRRKTMFRSFSRRSFGKPHRLEVQGQCRGGSNDLSHLNSLLRTNFCVLLKRNGELNPSEKCKGSLQLHEEEKHRPLMKLQTSG